MASILPRKPLPYDMNAEDERENALYNRNTALRQLAERKQGLGSQYAESAREVSEKRPEALRGVLNNFAGRGMAYSSGYGTAVGDTERNFSNTLAQLQRARDEGFAGISREENDVEEGYNLSLSEIQRAAARRLAEQAQAGKPIGLDPTPVNPTGPELQPDVPPPFEQVVQQPTPRPDYNDDERLRRIAQQIMNQERDFNSVRQSVDRLAGKPAGAYAPVAGDQQYLGDINRIMERVRAIFGNRGVSLGQY